MYVGSSRPAIVHRDINSRNILVKSDLTCVIGDFGFAMKVFGSSVVRDGDEDNSTITDVSVCPIGFVHERKKALYNVHWKSSP